ncbi:N-acetyl sugar amidotransferase [Lentilitoribacter sp. EG35]|uniref:N-acetyl sugar amidotransferase n=1 Tax=Lentilitoribacter sp. EG35 TaxID=3234192 RepID=UPI00345FB24F
MIQLDRSQIDVQMQTCTRCLYTTSHPLGLTLDEDGICSGCRIHDEKDTLDWSVRWKMLQELVSQYRVPNGRSYDCIVPVTGANDSYYIVHLVKQKLGLNPLLVTYNKYFNTPLGVRNLANLRIKFDCDILIQNINPNSVKNITRTTLRELGSVYWPCLAGQTVFPVQTAVRYQIPLIIWGAHQGVEQVGMFSHENEAEMTRRYRKEHDLMGKEADDLISNFDTLSEDDIWQYRYPNDAELQRIGVRGIYLGNYVRWDPKAQHEKMIKSYGYSTSNFPRTFDAYDHTDCYNYMDLHDHLKFLKHGYSKVTDHASREIRHGRISRSQAISMVSSYRAIGTQYSNLFCEWLELDDQSLGFILDQHRNPLHWEKIPPVDWKFKHSLPLVEEGKFNHGFQVTNKLSMEESVSYITIGKGWP